jgi:formyltetrahydrofolate-dependent phosphoribosylglycinamide formyltransferase
MLSEFASFEIKHVTRDKNKQADKLVNQALNLQKDIDIEAETVSPGAKTIRLGVLISGGGTTLVNINKSIEEGKLNAEIPIVISSRSTVKGVKRAKDAGLHVEIIRKKDFADIKQFSKKIEEALIEAKVDLVIQGGWLCLWEIPARYKSKVMNIHPALLPSFGGKGMWGHHVHEAVLNAGCKISGCTVHFCNNEYDSGPIIIQRTCPVKENDTPDTLAARVFEQECIAYPQAINLFARGRIIVEEGRAKIT